MIVSLITVLVLVNILQAIYKKSTKTYWLRLFASFDTQIQLEVV
jgi:hypothetical protein